MEKLSGAPVSGLLPIPDVSNKKFPEAQGLHTIMWKWCQSDTYTEIGEIWNGPILRTAWSWKYAMKCLLAFYGRNAQ
jgi:hypothetical protein